MRWQKVSAFLLYLRIGIYRKDICTGSFVSHDTNGVSKILRFKLKRETITAAVPCSFDFVTKIIALVQLFLSSNAIFFPTWNLQRHPVILDFAFILSHRLGITLLLPWHMHHFVYMDNVITLVNMKYKVWTNFSYFSINIVWH